MYAVIILSQSNQLVCVEIRLNRVRLRDNVLVHEPFTIPVGGLLDGDF